ncbi:MAG: serine hydrolase domain-containing protein, partial [Acidimicrobiales bacterium]
FETRIVDLVGDALPAVDPAVTIEQLLGHTSGVGDYLDEEELGDIDDHVLDVPVHRLERPVDYLPLLGRHPQVDPPGTRFVYNNSGYVMLALAVERATGNPYHDEVTRRVFEPAAMGRSGFFRSDRLPGDTAIGYLADGRTNVFHLPVVGTGDGGAFTTAPDMLRFWEALWAGRIIDPAVVERMTTPRSDAGNGTSYGLGFWVGVDGETPTLEGIDAGVSFRSGSNPSSGITYCVMANDSSGVWPLARLIDSNLGEHSTR